MATAVFFHAHPDDETISTGGTMARMSADGHRVVLVTATAGELGEVPEGMLDPGETLAQRRDKELEAACQVLGVARRVCLGYGDSGMAGEPSNDVQGAFCRVDTDEAAAALAEVLIEEQAEVLTAYDENGGYGHPDHVQVNRVGVRAAAMAKTPRVYLATVNRDHVVSLMDRASELGVAGLPEDGPDVSTLGVPGERITTAVDVRPFLGAKRAAMAAHASQIAETSFFLAVPPEAYEALWGTEWYIHQGLGAASPMEGSLLSEGR